MKTTKLISLLLSIVMLTLVFAQVPAFALTESEIQSQIDALEKKQQALANEIKQLKQNKAAQTKIKNALDKQIAVIQQQIDVCNNEIEKTNKLIADNEAKIAAKRSEMNTAIFEYKKRIRAIYMSGSSGSGIEILLGAKDVSDFLLLSQATLNISRRDKRMVDDIVEMIKEVEAKIAENKELIEKQKVIKAELDGKQAELDKQVDAVMDIIVAINDDLYTSNSTMSRYEKEIEDWNDAMDALSGSDGGDPSPFDGIFTWPVPGFTNRTSEYGPRWNKNHAGIDISQGGIANAKVVAIASGTAKVWYNSCTHNYGKYKNGKVYSCTNSDGNSCGGGYGNYLSIEHGLYKGISYRSVYAHLAPGSITVRTGQKVGKGQMIGRVGTTGRSTGYHLHFEIRENGEAKNPMNYY